MVLEQLKPESLFRYFEKLTTIPRGSGNEKEVSDYLVSFAKERGLEVRQDEFNNVVIKKAATPGYENAPAVIIQGHMDMVCEKNSDTEFDFEKDPLNIRIDGDWIAATGTTLGADNGIAVAMGLALLDSNQYEHPALEVVITTDEETGMTGAIGIDTSDLKAKYFINVDSESEGTFIVGCAGGQKTTIELPLEYATMKESEPVYKLSITGLKGGHSGEDINKNRANANKLMGRILYGLSKTADFKLINVTGGAKDNAIPRECFATISMDDYHQLVDYVEKCEATFKSEYATADAGVSLKLETSDRCTKAYSDNAKKQVIDLLNVLPNGIQTMSPDIEKLVESSLNLGVVYEKDNKLSFVLALRSSVRSRIDDISNRLEIISNQYGAEYIVRGAYPGWAYKKDSQLRELFLDTYKDIYGKEAGIKAIHAGLECGIFAEKLGDVDIISLGPDMEDIHTPEERLNIPSTARTFDLLVATLKNMK